MTMITFLGTSHSLKLYDEVIKQSKNDRDIVVSCQYPYKVPPALINNHICVNIHYGILPYYAGCNPIYWQMMKDNEAGVTLHYMNNRFDSGDIIEIKKIPTGNLVANEVFEALAQEGLKLFKKHYKGILDGKAPRFSIDSNDIVYYNKHDVNFNQVKHLGKVFIDDKRVRALHFEGKQYPIIEVNGLDYELRRVKS